MARVWVSMTVDDLGTEGLRRKGAGRVARVHARLLDVLHDTGDEHLAGRSRTASTSTSMASSRNRSTSTGRSADTPPSRPSDARQGRPRTPLESSSS